MENSSEQDVTQAHAKGIAPFRQPTAATGSKRRSGACWRDRDGAVQVITDG
jgi:hypothetical protein